MEPKFRFENDRKCPALYSSMDIINALYVDDYEQMISLISIVLEMELNISDELAEETARRRFAEFVREDACNN